MTTSMTRNVRENTSEGVLFVGFELSEETWKLGFTTANCQQPRERTVTARQPECVLGKIAHAHAALACRKRRPWSVAAKRVVKGSSSIGFCRRTGAPTMWWIPPLLRSIAVAGPRAMGWTCASC